MLSTSMVLTIREYLRSSSMRALESSVRHSRSAFCQALNINFNTSLPCNDAKAFMSFSFLFFSSIENRLQKTKIRWVRAPLCLLNASMTRRGVRLSLERLYLKTEHIGEGIQLPLIICDLCCCFPSKKAFKMLLACASAAFASRSATKSVDANIPRKCWATEIRICKA